MGQELLNWQVQNFWSQHVHNDQVQSGLLLQALLSERRGA